MAKRIKLKNLVASPVEPTNTNDIWVTDSTLKGFTDGEWKDLDSTKTFDLNIKIIDVLPTGSPSDVWNCIDEKSQKSIIEFFEKWNVDNYKEYIDAIVNININYMDLKVLSLKNVDKKVQLKNYPTEKNPTTYFMVAAHNEILFDDNNKNSIMVENSTKSQRPKIYIY